MEDHADTRPLPAAPPSASAPPPVMPQASAPPAGPRRAPLVMAVAGLLVLAAASAGGVVAFGPPGSPGRAAAPSPGAATSTGAAASGRPSSDAPEPPPTPAPSVTGRVKDGVHTGDLRFFLLPAPEGADPYSVEEGDTLTLADFADDERAYLTEYGFTSAATRSYLTADGGTEVTIMLTCLGGESAAARHYADRLHEGTRIPLSLGHPATAYHLKSGSAESSDSLLGVSYQGDVHITISVTGAGAPQRTLLARLLDQQYERLTTGR